MSFSELYADLFRVPFDAYRAIVLRDYGRKGIGYCALLDRLHDHQLLQHTQCYAASSFAALYALFLALRLDSTAIRGLFQATMSTENTSKFSGMWFFKMLQDEWRLGKDDGARMEAFIKKAISMRVSGDPSSVTMRDLKHATGKMLVVNAYNINRQYIEYFDSITYPHMPVYKAVRMAIAVPGSFSPVLHDGDYWMEGSLLDDFPIEFVNRYYRKDEILAVQLQTHVDPTHIDYDQYREIKTSLEWMEVLYNAISLKRELNPAILNAACVLKLPAEKFPIMDPQSTMSEQKRIYDESWEIVEEFLNHKSTIY
jgi:predicted acylesterase/phospholipase RssA